MPNKPEIPDALTELRRRAEVGTSKRKSKTTVPRTENHSQRLLHELEVHQIELEMQIGELRLARDEAESVREKYTDLYDFSPVGYFTLSPDYRIRMANLTGAALIGIDRSQLLGRSFALQIAPEMRADFARVLKQAFDEGAEQSMDLKLLSKDLPAKLVTLNFKGTPDGCECNVSMVDITARKRDENALKISEIRFRRLFETAHDGVLLLDPETRKITEANPFMTKLLGYSHAQLVGKELYEIGLLKDQSKSREMFKNLKKTLEVRYENLPLKTQNGRHQEVEVVANLYQENDRSVIQCNIRDITARKLAEIILRQSEALFFALIEQVPVGVYVLDAKLRLLQANPLALRFFNNIHPLIGRDFSEIIHLLWAKGNADTAIARFLHTYETGESFQSTGITKRRLDNGVREVFEWQIQRVILPSGELALVCFFNNITERIKAESARRRLDILAASNLKLKREIVHRLAMEEKLHETEYVQSRLLEHSLQQQVELRGMSHKILHAQEDERKRISRELHDVIAQTLVGINVHVAALAQETTAELGSLQQRIADTHQMVERSVEIVHQFARELRPTVLDDVGLIPALQAFLKGFMETTGIRVSLKISPSIEESAESIRTTFYRIIQEALMNVAKHAKASKVEISIRRLVDATSLRITDDGHGFEVEEIIHPNTNNRLGLLGMRERAEMVGGVFSVESAPGNSTTVRVMINTELETTKKNFSKKSVKRPTATIK
ncbi:MAG: PAS domain S-box protein [Armatimonadetes bacterium]|nr:PAS domain S-box protein [Akkermansiaceae bacterium]